MSSMILLLLMFGVAVLVGWLVFIVHTLLESPPSNDVKLDFLFANTDDFARHCKDIKMVQIGSDKYVIKIWLDTEQVGYVRFNYSDSLEVDITDKAGTAHVYYYSEGSRVLGIIKQKFIALNRLHNVSNPKKDKKEEVNPKVVKELPSPDIVDLLETLKEAKLRNDIPEIERVERSLEVRGYISE